jgi:hypothetical protein
MAIKRKLLLCAAIPRRHGAGRLRLRPTLPSRPTPRLSALSCAILQYVPKGIFSSVVGDLAALIGEEPNARA